MTQRPINLAIVADWLPVYGGAEHVISALHHVWEAAPIFTTVARREDLGPLADGDIRTDPLLQSLFRLTGKHQVLLPLMPRAMERIDLTGYDIVLSSSHAVGKGIVPPATCVHVCYCHTPARYAWEMEAQYIADFGLRGPMKWLVQRHLKKLRRWDLSTAKRVDHFIANSSETQKRIREIYGRDSTIVHPPVDSRFFDCPLTPAPRPHPYFLALGRLVPYKRFDLLIELANTLRFPLKIAGTGGDFSRLKRMAGPTVEFLGHVPDADLPSLYANAECLLFPQIEDAGIVPLEAQACGVPVIAYGKGGVRDVVIDSVTGLLLEAQTVSAFVDGIATFQNMDWNRENIREHAKKFHGDAFKARMKREVESAMEKFRQR